MTNTSPPKLILHIGDPKTGTSSIQAALKRGLVSGETARPEVFMPHPGQANAIPVARAFLKTGDRKAATSWARQVRQWLAASQAEYAILSSEYFSRADVDLLSEVFARELPEHYPDMKVIAYARPHAGRVLAAFIQRTKTMGKFDTFAEFLDAIHDQGSLAYATRFGKWQDAFGDRFILRPFIRSELESGDAVADFCAQVYGEKPFSIADSVNENLAPGERTLSGLLLFHRRLKKKGVGGYLRDQLAKSIFTRPAETAPAATGKLALSRDTVERLIRDYSEDARQLDERFFGRNIFLAELEKARENARDEEIDISPARHFKDRERQEIRKLVDSLHADVERHKDAWLRHQKSRQAGNLNAALPAKLQPIDDNLSRLSQIFTGMAAAE